MTAELAESVPDPIDFLELAPENWINLGGRLGRQLREISNQVPLVAHGLSLSIGGPAPLDTDLVTDIRDFIDKHNVTAFTSTSCEAAV